MPRTALFLAAAFFLVVFVFRAAIQWRRTGATGIKLFSSSMSGPELGAAVALAIGFATVVIAPLSVLLGWPGGRLLFSSDPVHWIGGACAAFGICGIFASQLAMGDSWRVGLDENEATDLVTHSMFAWVRNPIYTFLLLSCVGFVAMTPNVPALLALAAAIVGVEVQVRMVEEPHLDKTHGSTYRDYAHRVGRFVPAVGRLPLQQR